MSSVATPVAAGIAGFVLRTFGRADSKSNDPESESSYGLHTLYDGDDASVEYVNHLLTSSPIYAVIILGANLERASYRDHVI
jgi:hypothetical protein